MSKFHIDIWCLIIFMMNKDEYGKIGIIIHYLIMTYLYKSR